MAEQTPIEIAWELLRPHWEIPVSSQPLPHTPVYSLLRLFLSPFLRSCLRWKLYGTHHIPRRGSSILAANHLSHVDPVAVIAAARRTTHYLAKDGHFSNPWTRLIMKATGQIETEREQGGSEALRSAATVLSKQHALGIFPEGTRSKRNEPPFLLEGKTGVARLAASYPTSTVIPIAMRGTRQMMQPNVHKIPRLHRPLSLHIGKGVTWLEWLEHELGGNMNVENLQILATKDVPEIRSTLSSLYRRFTDQLMGSLAALGAP